MPLCQCISFGCRSQGGIQVSRYLKKKHEDQDFEVRVKETDIFEPLNEWDFDIDVNLFKTHWSSKVQFNHNTTLLEYVFQEMLEFTTTPDCAKASVTTRLSSTKQRMGDQADPRIPETYDQLYKIIKPFLVPLHVYHVCPEECIIYRNEFLNETKCPVCNRNRYKDDGETPQRVFHYFPVTPRIRRMLLTERIFMLLTDHLKHHQKDPFIQTDKHESKVWKNEYFGSNGMFADVDVGIALSICLDGVNPFNKQHISYSMWPIEMMVDNFPPALRKCSAGILLGGVIPGKGRGEPEADVYLEVLVDELMSLKRCKMKCYTGEDVTVSVRLLQYVLDFPAIGKILHFPGSARAHRACPFCQIEGESCGCNSTIFIQNRRFLPENHQLRLQTMGHVRNKEETRLRPLSPPSQVEIRELRKKYDGLPNKNQKKNFVKLHGVKGCYPFMKLDYHQFHKDLGPDLMHTLMRAGTNLCKALNGFISREKLVQVETDFKEIRVEDVPPSLTETEIEATNEKLTRIIYPCDSTGCKKSFITETSHVYPTHAWHEYMAKNVMIFAIRDWSNVKMRRTLIYWLSVINRIEAYSIDVRGTEDLKVDMAVAATLMERDFPLSVNVVTAHFLQHEPDIREKFGPVHSRWMFPFERYNSFLTRRLKQRSNPEACIMKTIQMCDFVNDVILGNRLANALRDPVTNVEHILMRAAGISRYQVKGKRNRPNILSEPQQREIVSELGLDSSVLETKLVQRYQTKNLDEAGPILYTSKKKNAENHEKSSRFVSVGGKFGEIMNIYEVNGDNVIFEVSFFLENWIDYETKLPFAKYNGDRFKKFCSIESLSRPLIVGLEQGFIYFISVFHDSKFDWLSSHIYV